MRFKIHVMLAIGCVSLLALSIPAFSRPLSNGAEAKRGHASRAVQSSQRPAPKPRHVAQQPAPERMAEPISLSARMKPAFGMPALVAEARKYMGTNPTDRKRLWCATFMNLVLAKLGYAGTNSDAAKSFAYYGRRISEPRVGAIAVLTRGKRGGHVGVVSGIDKHDNPVIISGNHNKRVGEAVYARSRVIAYVMPTERRAMPTQVAERGPASRPVSDLGIESPIAELLAAIEAEQARAERPAPPQQAQRPVQQQQRLVVPHRIVQQVAEPVAPQQHASPRAVSNPFSELIGRIERAQAAPPQRAPRANGSRAVAETGRGVR